MHVIHKTYPAKYGGVCFVQNMKSKKFELLDPQSCPQLGLVEADDDLGSGIDDRYSHLAGLVYHLLASGEVAGYVVFREADVIGLKEGLGQPTVYAGGC